MAASDELSVVVHRPNPVKSGAIRTLAGAPRTIRENWSLFAHLSRRDLVAVYRKSFVGLVWLLIGPTLSMASWILLRAGGVLTGSRNGSEFVVYILTGATLWGALRTVYVQVSKTLTGSNSLLLQVSFPHQLLLFKQVYIGVILHLFALAVAVVVALIFGPGISFAWLLVPFALLPLFLLGAGLGLLVALVSAVTSDVDRILDVAWGFAFVATPIIYQADDLGAPWGTLSKLNPLSHLVGMPRALLLDLPLPAAGLYALSILFSLLLFLLAFRIFVVGEAKLIERLL